MTHKAQKRSINDAMACIRGLQRRVEELEKRVAELEIPSDQKLWAAMRAEARKPKRGRKPLHPPNMECTRNDILRLLEEYWPEFLIVFAKPDRNEIIAKYLDAFCAMPQHHRHRDAANHLRAHQDILIKFLKSDRYRSDPRNIANAMAGVTHISFWRSLKVCGQKPYSTLLGERVIKSYVERKYPHIARVFNEASNEIELAVRRRGLRSKDPQIQRLFSTSDYAWRAWQSGNADFKRIVKS